jgi:hypothetical protein
MTKNSPLVFVLATVIVLLMGVLVWQGGQRNCEKDAGPLIETRYMPFRGCLIKVGDSWKTPDEMKNDIKEGVQQMQDGAKKALQGILGK